MLRKSSRLRAAEVRTVIAEGRSARFGAISAKFMPTSGPSRAVVVVAKVFARSAVMRNRLRRVSYRVIKEVLPRRGVEVVFFVKEKDTKKLAVDITALCSKLT